MAKRTQISICIDDLFAASKAGHPAIKKHEKSGKTYASIDIWENDQPDKFGNDFSVSLYDKGTKKSTYIGNGKKFTQNNATTNDDPFSPDNSGYGDLPF